MTGIAALVLTPALSLVPASLVPAATASAVPTTARNILSWGNNASGELGDGTIADSAAPIGVLGGATAISAGGLHSLGLLANGTVVAWGSNAAGQLGDGTSHDSAAPVTVAGLTGVGCPAFASSSCVPIAAGGAHSLALRTDGTVVAWGANNFGQLGNASTADSGRPVTVTGLTDVVSLSAGSAQSLAVRRDGTVAAWGDDSFGQLGDNRVTRDPVTKPTTVLVEVGATVPPAFASLDHVASVSAGIATSFAVRTDGSVVGWGSGRFGTLGDGALSGHAGNAPTAVTVRVQVGPIPGFPLPACTPATCAPLTGVRAISSSRGNTGHSLAVRTDGSVVAWGGNFEGQLGLGFGEGFASNRAVPLGGIDGSPGKHAVAVSAGGGHSLALLSTGRILSWGRNFLGELGYEPSKLRFSQGPVAVPGVGDAVAIAAGGSHSLALATTAGPAAPPGPKLTNVADFTTAGPAEASEEASPANIQATAVTPGAGTHFAPRLAVDPTRPAHLAVAYADDQRFGAPHLPGNKCRLALSSDGGTTWTNRVLIGEGGDFGLPPSVTNPAKPMDACGNSTSDTVGYAIAFGPNGTLYYVYTVSEGGFFGPTNFQPNAGRNARVYMAASTDGGATFSTPVQVDAAALPTLPSPSRQGDQDSAADLVVDQATGEAYVAWVNLSREHTPYAPIVVAGCSLSGTALRCRPGVRSSPLQSIASLFKVQLAVGTDGRLFVGWADETELFNSDGNRPFFGQEGSTGPVMAKVVSSTDHGQTFGPPSVADRIFRVCPVFTCPTGQDSGSATSSRSRAFYDISIATPARSRPGDDAAGDRNGDHAEASNTVFVALSGSRFGTAGKSRIVLSKSSDGAQTFRSGIEIGVIAGLESHHQHGPGLSVSPDGRVDLAFFDRALDGAQDVYLLPGVKEHDSRGLKLSSVPSQAAILGPPGAADGGDDLAPVSVRSDAGRSSVAWLDSRFGSPTALRTDGFFATRSADG